MDIILKKTLFYTIAAVLLLLYWVVIYRRYKNVNIGFIVFLFFYRIPYTFSYIDNIAGDWYVYDLILSRDAPIEFGLGTDAIPWMGKFLKWFEPDTFEYFFAFSLFGYFATVIFYLIIHNLTDFTDKVIAAKVNIFPWILLYPSLHFYTINLGKDPPIYWGVAMVTLGLMKKRTNWFYVLLGVLISILVRPHMGAILVIALGFSLLISNEWGKFSKTILLGLLCLGAVVVIPQIISLFTLDTLSLNAIMTAIETLSGHVTHAGTYVDMTNYPLLLKMFTYLFRPLIIDSPTVMLYEYGLENILFLCLLLSNFNIKHFFIWLSKQRVAVKFCFVYFIIGTIVLCNGLSVYGLIIRQKTMVFLNFQVLLYFYIYSKNKISSKESS